MERESHAAVHFGSIASRVLGHDALGWAQDGHDRARDDVVKAVREAETYANSGGSRRGHLHARFDDASEALRDGTVIGSPLGAVRRFDSDADALAHVVLVVTSQVEFVDATFGTFIGVRFDHGGWSPLRTSIRRANWLRIGPGDVGSAV